MCVLFRFFLKKSLINCVNCMLCFFFSDNGRIHEQTCILNCEEIKKNTLEGKEHEESAKKILFESSVFA